MDLPLTPPLAPMETELVDAIPEEGDWQYEPKWDGFRCIAFRDGDEVYLQSRNGKPLGRYFPDVADSLGQLGARRFVLDGELVVPVERRLSFEQLQLRLHPAASRVAKLAAEHPALLVVFDLIVTERRSVLVDKPLWQRSEQLEKFADRYFDDHGVRLCPANRERRAAEKWFQVTGGALDGVIAKLLDAPYDAGGREAAVKVKNLRTADCVVAGFRYGRGKKQAASLLLGMYDAEGLVHHVGYTSGLSNEEFAELTPQLERLRDKKVADERHGFTGRSPGAPSRWSTDRSGVFEQLAHELVVEVQYDHVTGDRFRHGTRLLRFRPDKSPDQCSLDQIREKAGAAMLLAS